MKSQFDPDVWAALLMIIAVGFGGVLFLDYIVNIMNMHGILNLFDRELSQKGLYIISANTRNDYVVSDDNGEDSEFSGVENFYIGDLQITRVSNYEITMKEMKSSLNKNPLKLKNGREVNGICAFISTEDDFNEKFKNCNGDIMYQDEVYIYSPAGAGVAFFALTSESSGD